MLNVDYKEDFLKSLKKMRDQAAKLRIKKQVKKIIENPEIGKPMMYERKGTRELYVSPYRLAYSYSKEENKIIFLDIYHKDEQ
jgi:addiction module RelE/StbE family toxin